MGLFKQNVIEKLASIEWLRAQAPNQPAVKPSPDDRFKGLKRQFRDPRTGQLDARAYNEARRKILSSQRGSSGPVTLSNYGANVRRQYGKKAPEYAESMARIGDAAAKNYKDIGANPSELYVHQLGHRATVPSAYTAGKDYSAAENRSLANQAGPSYRLGQDQIYLKAGGPAVLAHEYGHAAQHEVRRSGMGPAWMASDYDEAKVPYEYDATSRALALGQEGLGGRRLTPEDVLDVQAALGTYQQQAEGTSLRPEVEEYRKAVENAAARARKGTPQEFKAEKAEQLERLRKRLDRVKVPSRSELDERLRRVRQRQSFANRDVREFANRGIPGLHNLDTRKTLEAGAFVAIHPKLQAELEQTVRSNPKFERRLREVLKQRDFANREFSVEDVLNRNERRAAGSNTLADRYKGLQQRAADLEQRYKARASVESNNPFTNRLWQHMNASEKANVERYLRRYADNLSSKFGPEVGEKYFTKVLADIKSGAVKPLARRLLAAR